jgi:7,8-dihydropterin-6-yl-methyl-4-(beta-D-ribofuranosyl)aminobenzene 5'-phosphate synthase
MRRGDSLRITVVYDNYRLDPRLESGWGFSALLEYHGHAVLFDTGADGPTLLVNLKTLSIEPRVIEAVVLSHAHGDHIGGLDGLLETGARPTVYLLPSFPEAFKRRIGSRVTVIETEPGQHIGAGISTTGALDDGIPEQALIAETGEGLVVVTGCAHPGVARLVARAESLSGQPVHLVLGGFHLRDSRPDQLRTVIAEFRRLGVERVAPCHCTGDRAIEVLAGEYGADFTRAGVGLVIAIAGVPDRPW